jgi:hypothetical protein
MGLADGVSAVSAGVSNEVSNEALYVHVRPPRAMERSPTDVDMLVIGPLDIKAAKAQEFVHKRAKEMEIQDSFLSYTLLNAQTDEAVILSAAYVYWRKEKSLWGRLWSNVSHVLLLSSDSVGIFIYSNPNSPPNAGSAANSSGKSNVRLQDGFGGVWREGEVVEIPCYSRDKAVALYSNLVRTANLMGNPACVIPLSAVVQDKWLTDREFRQGILAVRGRAPALDNSLDGYRFGSLNTPFRKSGGAGSSAAGGDDSQLLRSFQKSMEAPFSSWEIVDARVWAMVEAWDLAHRHLHASRCCAVIVINRSDTPLQLARIEKAYGKNVCDLGSAASGYDKASRCIHPDGIAVIFCTAFVPSPVDVGHIKVHVDSPAFHATLASTQRESCSEARGAYNVGFIEKSVSEWWSKYTLCIS